MKHVITTDDFNKLQEAHRILQCHIKTCNEYAKKRGDDVNATAKHIKEANHLLYEVLYGINPEELSLD